MNSGDDSLEPGDKAGQSVLDRLQNGGTIEKDT
jgi:hypothetical protein